MTLHPFIFAAQQLKRISYAECYLDADGGLRFRVPFHLGDYLVTLATVINSDGSLNSWSPHAERYALCLDHAGNSQEALGLFRAIMEGEQEVLLSHSSLQIRRGDVSPFADMRGKLGRIAVQRFGELASQYGLKDLAVQLFTELAEKIPADATAMSLIDARVRALQHLNNLGVKTLRSGSVTDELEKMRERQG